MKVLVANLGSTSFKFRLYEMESETQLARGAVENIGLENGSATIEINETPTSADIYCRDHAEALEYCLAEIEKQGITLAATDDFAIGFKAVHGGKFDGVQVVSDEIVDAMERVQLVAPAHNPSYTRAMRLFREHFPDVVQVAAFETGFHGDAPQAFRHYGIPLEWTNELGIKRFGFHGASHRYIAERTRQLIPDRKNIISCHLGGSSSLCAIADGQSLGASMGMSPQSGLPQSNRCGDFDPFAIPLIMHEKNLSLEQVLETLGSHSGLLGLSGISSDLREIEAAAQAGNDAARNAIDVFVAEIRRHLGGMLVRLNGADAIVFTGGIGERSISIRKQVCDSLDKLGIVLDDELNNSVAGEAAVHSERSQVEIWVVPTNEEIIVARQTVDCLRKQTCL